jgi:hypothetical protein
VVDVLDVAAAEGHDEARDGLRSPGGEKEVDVVGHQRVGVEGALRFA